jgi:hypothetical protein
MVIVCALPMLAQKYSGPRPAKPDVPYLVHADNLVETESAVAQQQDRKDETSYIIPGDHSPARTPLTSPVLVIRTEELQADKLQLYKVESKGGQRQILYTRKKKLMAHPIRLNVTRQEENLYKIEVDEILDNGEYSLTPPDSNQVFCFQVY